MNQQTYEGFLSNYILCIVVTVSRVAQSLQRLAAGWTIRGSNPGEDEIFRTCPDRPWGPPILVYNWYRVFPGGKGRPGRDADPSSPSSAVVKKEQRYLSTPSMGRTACTEPQCLYKGVLYLYITYCGDESGSGLVSVVFVYKLSLKMAAPFSNCSDVEQRALIRFLWSDGIKFLKFDGECLRFAKKAQRFAVQGGLFVPQ